MSEKIPISEDGIIYIAEKLYGDSPDYEVFRNAAEVRKKRKAVCIRYQELKNEHESREDLIYYLSKEFNQSMGTIKDILRSIHIYT